MSIVWKWLLRPIIIFVFGKIAADYIEDYPVVGMLLGVISLSLTVWQLYDIYAVISPLLG